MMCYRDRTYCGFYVNCKKANECSRCLTEDIEIIAASQHLQICQFDDPPSCYEPVNPSLKVKND